MSHETLMRLGNAYVDYAACRRLVRCGRSNDGVRARLVDHRASQKVTYLAVWGQTLFRVEDCEPVSTSTGRGPLISAATMGWKRYHCGKDHVVNGSTYNNMIEHGTYASFLVSICRFCGGACSTAHTTLGHFTSSIYANIIGFASQYDYLFNLATTSHFFLDVTSSFPPSLSFNHSLVTPPTSSS